MKLFGKIILCCAFGGICSSGLFAKSNKPNIVLLYLDDWAWNGSPVPMNDAMDNSFMPILEMSNFEKLATQGMKFTNAYGSPQCAPARVCVQTGQSTPRNGFTLVLGKIQGHDYYDERPMFQKLPMLPNISATSLSPDATTIPEVLKPLGYVSAHLGKWHMYSDPGAEGYVLHDGDNDNKPGSPKDPAIYESDPKLMFSITEKAIGFIEKQVEAGNPFYCQISHFAMHSGAQCLKETRDKYAKLPELQAYYKEKGLDPDKVPSRRDPAVWLGMGEDLDGRIGAVLDKLEELGIEDNTYVVVVSDNGYRHDELGLTAGKTQPLHGHKWWAWQGGIRVPMIVRGPGIKGNSSFDANVVNYDFFPTFVEWAGGDPEKLENIDGVSLAGYMQGEQPSDAFRNRNLVFHVPHYREEVPHSAIISGHTKVMHFYERPDTPMMFDLSKDPGEVSNIARENPESHKKLFDEMMAFLKKMDARFPKTNPDFDLDHYKQQKNYARYIEWGPFEGNRPLEKDEK